ncbi:MAG: mycothiol synthase [Acidimicrobiales bacterium]
MDHVEVKRRMGESDIAEVSELLHEVTVADGHRPLGEHKWLDLVHGGRTGFAGFVAREGGRLIGYAQLSRGHNTWGAELVIHPGHRGPGDAVGITLLAAAITEIRRMGGGHLHLWVPKPTDETDAMALAGGLVRGRDLLQMRRPLPIEDDHEPVATGAFEPGLDESAWLVVNNRAFASHPEQGDWNLDTLLEREAESWFDARGFLLHERDGRLAASCWTKIHGDETPRLGEIYVISVDPDFQGLGLGRALVLAGLDYLAGAGLTVGMLYVDSANETAVALYRRLGFVVDHVDRAYTADIAAG